MKKLESFLHPELGNHNYGQITTDNFLLLSQIKRLKAWVKLQAEKSLWSLTQTWKLFTASTMLFKLPEPKGNDDQKAVT